MSPSNVGIDFETTNPLIDLYKKGLYNYAMSPLTRVLMMAFAFDDEPVEIWLPGQPFPARLADHIRSGGTIRAWNAAFERVITEYIMHEHGMPIPKLSQWECSAARARAHGLPGALKDAALALGLPLGKDPEGARLIKEYCSVGCKSEIPPADLELFINYCQRDVEVERLVCSVLRELDGEEQDTYLVNEIINDRGVPIDTELARAAQVYGAEIRLEANEKIRQLTQGEVKKASARTSRDKWLKARLTPAQIERLEGRFDERRRHELAQDQELNPDVAELIDLVDDAGGATIAKYESLATRAIDNRVMGAFMFNGGGQTGRFSSFGIQLHNLSRDVLDDPDEVIKLIKAGRPVTEPAKTLKRMIRSVITSPRGLVWGDFSNIEGRVAPWLEATELGRAKLKVFADGIDPYRLNAAAMYGVDYAEVDSKQRQAGKTLELACFGSSTKVLTSNGVKNITDVQLTDLLWDGKSWVQHQGVIYKGVRRVLDLCGVEVTPDHLIRTPKTWLQAQQLASNKQCLIQALEHGSAILPSSAQNLRYKAHALCVWSAFSVTAMRSRIWSTFTTYLEACLRGVASAPKKPPGFGGRIFSSMPTHAPMTIIEVVCSAGLLLARTDATTLKTKTTGIMGPEGSLCTNPGSKIKRLFSGMLSRLTDGITLSWILTALMSTKDTSRVTFALSPDKKTVRTGEQSKIYSSESLSLKPVFDILNSGSLNRFTIITDAGPLIVHNCGFLGGAGAIKSMGQKFGLTFTDEEAKQARDAWRRVNPWAKSFGVKLEVAVAGAVETPGEWLKAGRVAYAFDGGDWLWCRLPSGRLISYFAPRLELADTPYGETKVVTALWGGGKPLAGQSWPRRTLYSGLLLENVTQATAACFLRHALVEAYFAGIEVVAHVHDEIVAEGCRSEDLYRVMSRMPDWSDLVVPVKVEQGERYGK